MGTNCKGLRSSAEIEVWDQFYAVGMACEQALNSDGSLTLKPYLRYFKAVQPPCE